MAVIRVSGNVGSGKTTLCEMLAKELGHKYYYTGQIFRDMAKEKNLSIEEFYQQMQNDPELEKSIDIKQMKIMLETDNVIVQGRMAPFLPPYNYIDAGKVIQRVFNLFIKVEPLVGAQRQLNRPENAGRTLEEMVELSTQRMALERKRLKELWNVENCFDESKFDLVMDTTNMTIDEVFKMVLCWLNLHAVFKRY